MNRQPVLIVCALSLLLVSCSFNDVQHVVITVDGAVAEAPVTLGIPFPQGALFSEDHIRVLNGSGEEIASQTTKVTTWMPADESIKWVWVFFFADESEQYTVEYGDNVRQSVKTDSPIQFTNNQREYGGAEINTGPLRFRIRKNGSGFIDRVEYNARADSFGSEHLIATGITERGSFLDLMDDAGIDTSSAVVHQQFIEKGSGPMHAIVRVEGEYRYDRDDHKSSPFVTWFHAYAGKSYIRVLHTITYTGKPDRSAPLDGRQHRDIATQADLLVDENERRNDPGITQPKDRIAAAGFGLNFNMDGEKVFRTGLRGGNWWEDGEFLPFETAIGDESFFSVFQTGPNPTGIPAVAGSGPAGPPPVAGPGPGVFPPAAGSGPDERIDGFNAKIESGRLLMEAQKAEGWVDLSNEKWGISIGIRNMMEEYPNEITVNLEEDRLHAFTWSPNEVPKSFERWTSFPDGGMVGNFAQGITKTSEIVLNFHDGSDDIEQIRQTVNHVLDPPVAHAEADWYSRSGVYGTFESASNNTPVLERGLQYKYKYMQFNQKWEPWYGMFDYGDMKLYYRGDDWIQWGNNEPAQDFQWWLNFMRTGDRSYYLTAEAKSRHTMDVDNIHWPAGPVYRGDTNASTDYWLSLNEPEATPYLGMGNRHANQQNISMLTAHVWVQGWLASYYLSGYHRGLDVARLTGDYYIRRTFGEHGLTGRRLYLSVWNLAELYDATKEEIYLSELTDRTNRMLELQKRQGGRIAIDRYGYSQNYVSHGLSKYLQLFNDRDVELALIDNARSLLMNPPLDHEMESYLSSIHALILGYDLTGHDQYLTEACRRAAYLRTDEMEQPFEEFGTQRELAGQMEQVSRLPPDEIWDFSGGIRIFGWTHAFGVPWLIDRLEKAGTDIQGLYQCTE